ncbi:formylmethanofuran dehydrogenase subunit C [Candidatus Bathyarchaeota archaeon]|nr:formylmethanofuran dehydrogenase subunit C [Candidatus Bathyarchaeota archaeon]
MKELCLRKKVDVSLPVDGQAITPDNLSGRTVEEIEELPLLVGNRERKLGELFGISGFSAERASEQSIVIIGNTRSFRGIGRRMTGGLIRLEGDAGFNLGEEMTGGTITVQGNVEDWAGCSMRGGLIEVHGKAGNQVGASIRGRGKGMTGGTIRIDGDAGYEVGSWMEGGLIHIGGSVDQFAGVHMRGGEILIEGNSDGRLGGNMRDGKIVLLGRIPQILPSFTFEEVRDRATAGGKAFKGRFYLFRGDVTEEGNGRLFISAEANPHLSFYEKYLE